MKYAVFLFLIFVAIQAKAVIELEKNLSMPLQQVTIDSPPDNGGFGGDGPKRN